MHIFLVGFMGSGKSTVGKGLSKKMDRELMDTDEYIEKKDGRPISKIFAQSGEGYFRLMETMVLKEFSPLSSRIISCGGGMAIKSENTDLMKTMGKIVYLRANPETILKRVSRSDKRPLLEGNKNIEFIQEMMEKRTPYYEGAADIIIDTDDKSIEEICDEIAYLAAL